MSSRRPSGSNFWPSTSSPRAASFLAFQRTTKPPLGRPTIAGEDWALGTFELIVAPAFTPGAVKRWAPTVVVVTAGPVGTKDRHATANPPSFKPATEGIDCDPAALPFT